MSVVAIVDSGLNLKHRDVVKRLWRNTAEIPGNGVDDDFNGFVDDVHGFDALTSAGLTSSLANNGDPQGHGTHVAGIVSRLAPKTSILPIRILDAEGNGRMSDALFAWSYALENGAKVINNSFGVVGLPPAEFSFMEEAVRLGRQQYGAVFVAAAGNQSNNNDALPGTSANVPGMISVGATNASGDLASSPILVGSRFFSLLPVSVSLVLMHPPFLERRSKVAHLRWHRWFQLCFLNS